MSAVMRDVPGYEGRYSASAGGQIYSHITDRFLRTWGAGRDRDYQAVSLVTAEGLIRKANVHALVALAFNGPRPDGMHVDHIDGNKANNRPENLQWVSPAENNRRARALGLNKSRPAVLRGEAKPNCLISDHLLREARARRAAGETLRSLAAEYGLKKPTLCKAIKHGRAV
jgi:hypothetical protein